MFVSNNLLQKEKQMKHYRTTIISKYKTGRLESWTAWIKRGRSQGFCDALDQYIAEVLDTFFGYY